MGLTADITSALVDAFDGDLADATKAIVLRQETTAYDAATGAVTTVTSTKSTRGVVAPIDAYMADGEAILLSDVSFTILKSELDATPDVGDDLSVGGVLYNINFVNADPADVAWVIVGRSA